MFGVVSKRLAQRGAGRSAEELLKLVVTWSKGCWQPLMGFRRMTQQQRSNTPIRKVRGSRAKQVISELKRHGVEQIKEMHSPSSLLSMSLYIPSSSAFSLSLVDFHPPQVLLFPRGVSGVLAVLSAEARAWGEVRARAGEEERVSELCAVCLWLFWPILSEQSFYCVVSVGLALCRQLESLCMICWKSFRCDTPNARLSFCVKLGHCIDRNARLWFELLRTRLQAPLSASKDRNHASSFERETGNRHSEASYLLLFHLLSSQGGDCN